MAFGSRYNATALNTANLRRRPRLGNPRNAPPSQNEVFAAPGTSSGKPRAQRCLTNYRLPIPTSRLYQATDLLSAHSIPKSVHRYRRETVNLYKRCRHRDRLG